MVDGEIESSEIESTETNRELVRSFVNEVLLNEQSHRLSSYVSVQTYTEHNPHLSDGLESLQTFLNGQIDGLENVFKYEKMHKILADGNFVLTACEGLRGGVHTSFYDLYRIEDGKIVEHWDTVETIPPRSEWKNENGKF